MSRFKKAIRRLTGGSEKPKPVSENVGLKDTNVRSTLRTAFLTAVGQQAKHAAEEQILAYNEENAIRPIDIDQLKEVRGMRMAMHTALSTGDAGPIIQHNSRIADMVRDGRNDVANFKITRARVESFAQETKAVPALTEKLTEKLAKVTSAKRPPPQAASMRSNKRRSVAGQIPMQDVKFAIQCEQQLADPEVMKESIFNDSFFGADADIDKTSFDDRSGFEMKIDLPHGDYGVTIRFDNLESGPIVTVQATYRDTASLTDLPQDIADGITRFVENLDTAGADVSSVQVMSGNDSALGQGLASRMEDRNIDVENEASPGLSA